MWVGVCNLLVWTWAAVAADLGLAVLSSNRQALVTLNGGTGQWHRIEGSTNLLDWRALTSLCQTNPTSAWLDTGATNSPQRFYRSLQLTPLDVYVARPDTNYGYTLLKTLPGVGQTTFVLELRSQVWLTTNEVDRTLWKHWLIIVEPTGVTNPQSLLFISGGSNPGSVPTKGDTNLTLIALHTKTVVSELKMVPNEPLRFAGETTNRTEDEIIAYTWDKFLRTGDARWPARLPMTKAAVRAMDTVTAFCGSAQGGGVNVRSFVVAGASKRGWTTWTTAAVDQRVAAIIPLVIDILNVQTSMVHHYSAYGFWAEAIQDYTNSFIPDWFGTPQMAALMDIVDPYAYRRRLTMPKFIINDTGDQFFLPDSSQFYFDDLLGVKYLRYVPNTDHSLGGSDAYQTIEACYQAVLAQAPLPQFSWTLQTSNSIRVVAGGSPTAVTLWSATNAVARDFRLETIGKAWKDTALTNQGSGVYVGTVPVPAQGWTGFFVELTYPGSAGLPYKFTTHVYVVPDVLPYHFTNSVKAPVILNQPASQSSFNAAPVTFTVLADGPPQLNYQWRFNGTDIPGATATAYTIATPLSRDNGFYSVRVTNVYGAVISSNASLTVVPLVVAGDNSLGQLDLPAAATNVAAIAAGAWHSLALDSEGGVIAWGDNWDGQCDVPADLGKAVSIAAGGYHSLALRVDRTVVGWGADDYGQALPPPGLSNVIAIAAGTWHSMALRADGTVVGWGDNSWGQTSVPAGLADVAAVAAGGNHSLALRADGTVVAWGENTDAQGGYAGQSRVPDGLADVVAISAGEYHSLALQRSGRVMAWGDNALGQCAPPTSLPPVAALAGGGAHSVVAMTNGSVVAWGADWNGQCDLPATLTNAVAVAAGNTHTLVLMGLFPAASRLPAQRQGDYGL
jgi:PhoPQ-activated pathogenicity-related protein